MVDLFIDFISDESLCLLGENTAADFLCKRCCIIDVNARLFGKAATNRFDCLERMNKQHMNLFWVIIV